MTPGETARRIGAGARDPANWLQLVKFGAVGASGYVINLAVFAALLKGADFHHTTAAIGAFCVAITNNFWWNRHWTFSDSDGKAAFQAPRFLAVSLAALGANLIFLQLLIDSGGLSELPAQAIAVAAAMPFNFIGNKLWTFG